MFRAGASWFARNVFVGNYEAYRENIAEAIKAEQEEYEAVVKTAPFLSGLDFADDAQADKILARLKETKTRPFSGRSGRTSC
jgi:hypothetical protein